MFSLGKEGLAHIHPDLHAAPEALPKGDNNKTAHKTAQQMMFPTKEFQEGVRSQTTFQTEVES